MATCALQVVHALAALLVAAGTDLGAKVYTDRFEPIAEAGLPAALVLAGDEQITPLTVHAPKINQHELDVMVAIKAHKAAGLDALLDTLKLQVLRAVFDTEAHARLNNLLSQPLAEAARLTRLPQPEEGPLAETDWSAGSTVLHLRATFHTVENAPETFA
jgi:hypothetical protein